MALRHEELIIEYATRIDRLLNKIALREMKGNCFGSQHANKAGIVREHVWLFFRSPGPVQMKYQY